MHEHKPAASAPPVPPARCRTTRGTVRGTGRAPSDARNTPHTQTRRRLESRGAAPANRPRATRRFCATHAPRQAGFSLPAAPGYTRGEPSPRELARRCGAVRCALCAASQRYATAIGSHGKRAAHTCMPSVHAYERERERERESGAPGICAMLPWPSHCHAPGIGFSWAMELSKMRPLGSLRRMRSLDQRSSIYTAVVGVC